MRKSLYKEGAELFRSLGHPARLQILDELRRAEACVCHLQTVLRRPQSYVSQQLRVLRDMELVTDDNAYFMPKEDVRTILGSFAPHRVEAPLNSQ